MGLSADTEKQLVLLDGVEGTGTGTEGPRRGTLTQLATTSSP